MSKLNWVAAVCGVMLVVAGVLALSFIGPLGWARGYPGYSWGIGPWPFPGFWFPFMAMMGVCMLVFCALFMGGRVRPMHSLPRWQDGSWLAPRDDSPSNILENRYSRGEITKEQFEEMKRELGM